KKAARPSWSPDGTQIAFDTSGPSVEMTSIGVVNADGTSEHVVASTPQGSDFAPAWSPDGSTIVYASIRNENWGIFAIPAAGGAERTLRAARPGSDYVDDPTWSPDGKLIAFVAGDGISLMRTDGSRVRRVFRRRTRFPAGAIAWRPTRQQPSSADKQHPCHSPQTQPAGASHQRGQPQTLQ